MKFNIFFQLIKKIICYKIFGKRNITIKKLEKSIKAIIFYFFIKAIL